MRASVQIISLVGMLILGIFLGIDSAEKNIQKIQGTEGAPRAIQISPQNGKIEIAVLGEVVETSNPVEKMDRYEVAGVARQVEKESNRLAAIGNQMGTEIREATRKIAEFLFSWAD
ncbi:DUF3679 domain-containing protein [Lihuaxuella thermophila]|uniref:Uncharacterized protein n=1 Tax=Lihuaxuella thermophila TaxID=1173111 RepID=A0A1H8D9B8_9BACL|nr:DUF3679 domain-containing protein [Lihuaxuella thermophila]SEN03849.1 Protein of unknown function [Lihuaxuella thermophila]